MYELFVTSPKGLSHLLADELVALGVKSHASRVAGVVCQANLETAYRICLWSRLANRVLVTLESWPAANVDELYSGALNIDWSQHMTVEESFAIQATVVKSADMHSQFAALKLKDAIADYFRKQTGARPSVDTETPDIRFHIHLNGKRAQLSLDLSGESLHRRGYRQQAGEAPLKENLAAALLLESRWPAIARTAPVCIDPMCGSATLLIEAALMATDTAPGLYRRRFGFNAWQQHVPQVWNRVRKEAEQRQQTGMQQHLLIRGYDQNADIIATARQNIKAAGMEKFIKLTCCDLESLPQRLDVEPDGGLVICNPPYGERLGEVSALRVLYAALGRLLREQFRNMSVAILTANDDLMAFVGVIADQRSLFYNGALECQLYQFSSGRDTSGPLTSDFANRLKKNLKHIQRWAERNMVQCYRIYDADLPEYAVAIDIYSDTRANLYAHIQEYQAPKTIAEDKALARLQTVLLVTQAVLNIPFEHVYLKVRQQQKGRSQYQKEQNQRRFIEVNEGAARLLVNLGDYLDTGLFLDHRNTRQWIAENSRGKRFLNLFCYTAVATVHAALGGANSSLSIDMSATYLDWAERNFRNNKLDMKKHKLLRDDCLVWLARHANEQQSQQFDLIFLDPPTFSNSKRMQDVLDVQRDHVALIRQAMKLLCQNGTLIFSTNYRRFRLDEPALAEFAVENVTKQSLPEDFSRRQIHQCWHIQHQQ